MSHPDSTEEIARAVSEKLSGGLDHPWAHWRNYHPVVKATVEWLDEHGYLAIVEYGPVDVSE